MNNKILQGVYNTAIKMGKSNEEALETVERVKILLNKY